jgi:hypothetical protein
MPINKTIKMDQIAIAPKLTLKTFYLRVKCKNSRIKSRIIMENKLKPVILLIVVRQMKINKKTHKDQNLKYKKQFNLFLKNKRTNLKSLKA